MSENPLRGRIQRAVEASLMGCPLTPASQRCLSAAAGFARGDVGPWQLLRGLAGEPECRAAQLLAQKNIDADAIDRQRASSGQAWPPTAQSSDTWYPSPELEHGVAQMVDRLADLPRPWVLATEHLLLALLLTEHEVGEWLTANGITAEAVLAELHRLNGFDATPIDVELEVVTPVDKVAPATVGLTPSASEPIAKSTNGDVWRILDSSTNRAGEAIRVIEDFVRFGCDNPHLTEQLKQLRHDLATLVATWPRDVRLAARDTPGDVGTTISTAAEGLRLDVDHVLAANFRRLQESLRSLEEYSKLLLPELAPRFEQLRYAAYTLEKRVAESHGSGDRLAGARLYVLIDGGSSVDQFERLAQSLVEAGVDLLQLRDKHLPDRPLLDRARRLRAITRGTICRFVMNDRPDLARLADADGVHVGQDELSVADCRQIVGPRALIGVSTHSIEQARQAVAQGASYLGVGPTFPSRTKQFTDFPGLAFVRAVAAEIRVPAFAIGGIDADNLRQVLAAGLGRIAVGRAVTAATDPGAVVRSLLSQLATPVAARD